VCVCVCVCKNIDWVRLVQKVVHLQLYTRPHTTVNILVPKKVDGVLARRFLRLFTRILLNVFR